ncbi:MAG: B12-binding domain-containing radical SAM protein, partial [Calditrichia bacterium]
MKTIVLVNPPLTGEEKYGALSGGGAYLPPLGVAILAAVIRDRGYRPVILDFEGKETVGLNNAVAEILKHKPDALGITAATVAIFKAAELAEKFKKKSSVPVIIGGPHISAVPRETMDLFPDFDFGVIGEGEETLPELLDTLTNCPGSLPLDEIRGVIFRRNSDDQKLVVNEKRLHIIDLDKIPFPAWDLLPDLKNYYRPQVFGFKQWPVASIITSRGCFGKCTFCDRTVSGSRLRFHSADYVMGMIKELYHHYGIRDLIIYDDCFLVNKKRINEFYLKMKQENLKLTWHSNGRIDTVTPEILRKMKEIGCWQIAYGIESGSQQILDSINKNISLEKVKEVFKWTKQANIKIKCYFIIGLLKDTRETIEETKNFILNNDFDILSLNHFTPFPNTWDYEHADNYGDFHKDWRLLNQHNPVFIPQGVTKDY